jgi:dihydrolipoamide dehydrogenase
VSAKLSGAEIEEEREFDRVLIAVGRRPNSADLGLEELGVAIDERGFIETDAQRRSAAPNIFAIGDVAGEPMLAHKATHEARAAVEAIAGQPSAFDPAAIPAVVFTDPEIAWTGLSETDARTRGIDIEVTRFPWSASGRATTIGRNDGVTKLILEPGTDRILGVGIAGSGAGELIAEATLAVEMGARVDDLRLTIHAHPTLSETLMEAAEVFFNTSPHYLRRR